MAETGGGGQVASRPIVGARHGHQGASRRWAAAVVVALGLLGVSCRSSSAPEAPLPPPVPVVSVVMEDYRFVHSAALLNRGRVVFRVRNAGREKHELTLVRRSEDAKVPIDAQLRGTTRDPVVTTAILLPHRPGTSGTFAVDLVPARYALICFLPAADGQAHYLKGMSTDLRVR